MTLLDQRVATPRRSATKVVALAIGAALWLAVGGGVRDWNRQAPMLLVPLGVAMLALIPPVRRLAAEVAASADHALRNPRRATVAMVGGLSAAYLLFTAMRQGRWLHPTWHDEFSYLIQMQMVARGRLWMPGHPLGTFFDSFYLLADGVYASMYFPGTALLYAPTVWLGLPPWVMPLGTAAAVCALTYRIVAELVDGVWGLIAAAMLASISPFRTLSVMVLSQMPVMLLGLLLVWAWLKWRRARRDGWVLFMGILAGWAAITRPLDALCFALPVAVGVCLDLRGRPHRRWLALAALALVGASPFLAVQFACNVGIAGRWWESPWQAYVRRELGIPALGWVRSEPAPTQPSPLPQKQRFREIVSGLAAEHRLACAPRAWFNHRLPMTVAATLPQGILLALAPLGLLAQGGGRRWVLGVVPLLFVLGYAPSLFFTPYYPLIAAPGVILWVVLGAKSLCARDHGMRPGPTAFVVSTMLILCLASLPEFSRGTRDRFFEPRVTRALHEAIAALPDAPAVVLVRYSPWRRLDDEPVYNAAVAWPDDARVVIAHDLGERNGAILRYYAGRRFYRFDEADLSLTPLDSPPR